MKQPVFLRIYRNGTLVNVKQSTDVQIVIGRNDGIQLQLQDPAVSPLHAVLEERDAGFYVSDLGSEHGTFKNGVKVFDEKLDSGDEIQIGPFKIEFFLGVPKPTQPPKTTVAASEPLKENAPVDFPPPASPKPVAPPPAAVPPQATSAANPPPPPKNKAVLKTATPASEDSVPMPAEPPPTERPPAAKSAEPKMEVISAPVKPGALTESLKNSKGTLVEVVVAWGDRVISTHHFDERGTVTIGTGKGCTINLPLIGVPVASHDLLVMGDGIRVGLTPEMSGDFYRNGEHFSLSEMKRKNRVVASGGGFEIQLGQGEMIRLGLMNDRISIYVRFVQETPRPLIGPLLDLTASESTVVVMSLVIAAILGLYMLIYSPKPLEDESRLEEALRKATVTFKPPPKVAKVGAEQSQKKIVTVKDQRERTTTKQNPGQAGSLRATPNRPKTNQVAAAVEKGASMNTGKSGSNAQTKARDVTKTGLLSTFGGKGAQSKLAQAYSGAGDLIGEAESKTGFAGSNEARAGENLGGRLKNVGAGGKGSSTYGIDSVGTKGKGTGSFGFGDGGIGKKGSVDLNVGDSEAEFEGSIDREAIRRVIRASKKQIEYCYQQALRKNSEAYGKVEIQWNIEEQGRATNAKVVSNTVGDRSIGDCVARVIRGLKFPEPPPNQIAQVTYPFVFALQ